MYLSQLLYAAKCSLMNAMLYHAMAVVGSMYSSIAVMPMVPD